MKRVPAFQMILRADNQQCMAAEVLSRWETAGQLLGPAAVGPSLDWAEVDLALVQQLAQITHELTDYPRLFINVSPQTLDAPAAHFDVWRNAVAKLQAAGHVSVVLEITEAVPDLPLASRWRALTELGVELALDDFGMAFSTPARLRDYPWTYCKFDVRRITGAGHDILFCQDNRIRAIAEQVESAALSQAASNLGITWQQGYYHHKPTVLGAMAWKK